ncbi:unnamed protein product [Aspergillus oryzae RIB40]|uniref:DNA, SC103 n=1 Tax=Aspergillus oryzae (strain ATCC 42149 / RIB 40) TaxID=510516 RepID=Q2TY55_ASPOR|nr:unnamed protein product [Aspergillus oryzae RIB40]BAE65818.1 unnamed protein product [Aspergillus oryzae RIB40]
MVTAQYQGLIWRAHGIGAGKFIRALDRLKGNGSPVDPITSDQQIVIEQQTPIIPPTVQLSCGSLLQWELHQPHFSRLRGSFSGTLDSVTVQNPLDVEKALVFRHPLTATIAYGNRGRLARRERLGRFPATAVMRSGWNEGLH